MPDKRPLGRMRGRICRTEQDMPLIVIVVVVALIEGQYLVIWQKGCECLEKFLSEHLACGHGLWFALGVQWKPKLQFHKYYRYCFGQLLVPQNNQAASSCLKFLETNQLAD